MVVIQSYTMSYILNLHNAMYKLYLNKSDKNKYKNNIKWIKYSYPHIKIIQAFNKNKEIIAIAEDRLKGTIFNINM